MPRKIRYQNIRILVPAGTIGGTLIEKSENLDSSFSKATKLVMTSSNITAGGGNADFFEFGIRKPEGQIVDLIPDFIFFGSFVENFENSGLEIDCDAAGQQIICQVKPYNTTVNDLNINFTFKLEN